MYMHKLITWDEVTNKKLIRKLGICFEDVLMAIEKGNIVDILLPDNSRKNSEKIILVKINNKKYLVPYTDIGKKEFKTIIFIN